VKRSRRQVCGLFLLIGSCVSEQRFLDVSSIVRTRLTKHQHNELFLPLIYQAGSEQCSISTALRIWEPEMHRWEE
jgi:hypothetical protein